MKILLLPLLLVFFFAGANAHAFPELTRHNYFNCSSCHVAPSGGGPLNAYGRELSGELLSMTSSEGESRPFYGLFGDPQTLVPSAYVRALQLYSNNAQVKQAQAILMQADAALAAKISGAFTAVGEIGRHRIASQGTGAPREHDIFSRTHYVLYSTDSGFNVRAGKFMPAYGLNSPNHYLFVRRDTGLYNDTERYNSEASYLGDGFSVIATAIFGLPKAQYGNSREKGGTISLNKAVGEASRVGVSLYDGYATPTRRELAGVYGIGQWTSKLYSQYEVDWQHLNTAVAIQGGWVASHQLCYEFYQGVTPYLEMQWEKLNYNDPNTGSVSYGLGMDFFPRPHWEINGLLGQEKPANQITTTLAYLMLNLYL